MLSVTWDEIQKARDHNKVTEKGIEIITPIYKEISNFQENRNKEAIEKLKCLSESSFNDYQEFEKNILNTRDHFKN